MANIKFVVLLLIMSSITIQKSFSQTVPTFTQAVPPSPTASALHKFSDYPVNLNTGLVDISIPIYTVQINGIKVPIELKYHASGIKYDADCEGLGIGWTLFAGGMITAVQQGVLDYPGGGNNYFKYAGAIDPGYPQPGGQGENATLIGFDEGYEDSEYDTFDFTFPGNSGRFFFPGTGPAVITPLQNLKISGTEDNASIGGSFFDITDESGITYKFGHYSKSNPNSTPIEQALTDLRTCNFMLTEIISADKADTVLFNYTRCRGAQTKLVINDQTTIRDQLVIGPNEGAPLDYPYQQSPASYYADTYDYAALNSITFRIGHIAFTYSGTILTGINVYNNAGTTPVEAVTLQQSTFNSDFYKLDQVNFYDSALQKSYNYQLTYTGVPYAKYHTGIDYWGFHNGATFTVDYIPNFQVTTSYGGTITVGTMDRTANETAMLQGMLNKVTYPTGGSSVFTFEAHRHDGGQLAGGLRIKKIDNYDLNGSYLNSKWYTYGQTENGDGTLYKAIDPADYCYTDEDVYTHGVYIEGDKESIPVLPDYQYNERVYSAFPKFNNSWGGSSVVYDYVTEYTGDGINANGKTVYNYENIPDIFNYENYYGKIPMVSYSNSWKTGNLLSKQVYALSGSAYNLIYSLTNQYQDFNRQDFHCLKIMSSVRWHDDGMTQQALWYGLEYYNTVVLSNVYLQGQRLSSDHMYADYFLTAGLRLPTSTVEVKDGVSTTTQYTYDPTYLKPTQTVTTKSNGDNLLMAYTYPFSLTTAPYPAMVTNNILAPVITQSAYKNTTSQFLESTTTNYALWGTSLYAPQSVATQTGTNAVDTRLVYDAYDNWGNVTQRHKYGDANESYIWDYNHAYPVAGVTNAAAGDIAYTSFEADGTGNWTISSTSRSAGGVTGSQSYALSGNTISKSGLTAAKTYVVSYWTSASSPLSITGTITGYPVKGITINGCTYYVHQVTGQTAVTLSGSGSIDEVRLYPNGAQMTTYTYSPLVGITSSTDAKGEISYYSYDSFQRLQNISDQNGNIIKSFCYNYAGQPTNCSVNLSSAAPVPVITALTYSGTNNIQVSFTPIPNCTSTVITLTDQSTNTKTTGAGSGSSPANVIAPNAADGYSITVTCYSNAYPAGITSAPMIIGSND